MALRRIELAGPDIERQVTFIVRKLALDITANLRAEPTKGGTPVDTGFARSNWILRAREPQSNLVGSRPKEKGGAGVDDVAADAAVAEFVTGYRIGIGNVYITNLVPYVPRLNAGSSTQAPAGFVERAILKAIVEDSHR